jgi:SAM-dependent methyltransferase
MNSMRTRRCSRKVRIKKIRRAEIAAQCLDRISQIALPAILCRWPFAHLDFLCVDADFPCTQHLGAKRHQPRDTESGIMPMPNIHALTSNPRTIRRTTSMTSRAVASAYNHVGGGYGSYADGAAIDDQSPTQTSRFAHGDAIIWETVCRTINELRLRGVPMLRLLDAGCGPGTWVRRIARYAHRQGLGIDAVGVDISGRQLEIAREQAAKVQGPHATDGRRMRFRMGDLADPLPWPDGHFHIVLCNYVLNHLPKDALPRVAEELCRAASYRVIATVRAIAGPPTGCIIGTEQMREYRYDCGRGELRLVLKDGTAHQITFHLYSAEMLRAAFAPHATIRDLRAVDLFLHRFVSDRNWTANLVATLPGREEVMRELKEIEDRLCRRAGWVDHGTHILIVAQPGRATAAPRGARQLPEA